MKIGPFPIATNGQHGGGCALVHPNRKQCGVDLFTGKFAAEETPGGIIPHGGSDRHRHTKARRHQRHAASGAGRRKSDAIDQAGSTASGNAVNGAARNIQCRQADTEKPWHHSCSRACLRFCIGPVPEL